MRLLGSVAIFALSWGQAHAARDFTPQSGTWIISGELDGKPGRGMAIDVQGNTLFMQVFGYGPGGDAAFYTATGPLTSHSLTAPLMHYQGGRYFGSGELVAQEAGTAGNVTLSFESGLAGTVQFPGEAPVRMQRLLVQETDSAYLDIFSNAKDRHGNYTYVRPMTWVARGADVQHGWNVTLRRTSDTRYSLQLWDNKVIWYQPGGGDLPRTLRPMLDMDCTLDSATKVFDCQRLPIVPVSHRDSYTNVSFSEDINLPLQTARFRTIGNEVVGWAMTDGAAPQPLELMGIAGDSSQGDCGVAPTMLQSFYNPRYFLCGRSPVAPNRTAYRPLTTLMPTNGTWIVEDELNGKPGRGMALDVQDTQMIVQIFDYLPNGASTFHMGSGHYLVSEESGNHSVGSAELYRYAGGMTFGGSHQAAHAVDGPGPMQLEIAGYSGDDGIRRSDYFSSGTVKLPGEAPKRIRRLALEPQSTAADRLLGTWFLQWLAGDASSFLLTFTDLATATNAEGSEVTTPDGEVVCGMPPNQSNAGCSWRKMPGRMLSIGMMDFGRSSSLQVRDRHGNWKGLGPVQLPGLDMPAISY
ncbi:hypothetical protein GCM10027082_26950 [Comamonas humi]